MTVDVYQATHTPTLVMYSCTGIFSPSPSPPPPLPHILLPIVYTENNVL